MNLPKILNVYAPFDLSFGRLFAVEKRFQCSPKRGTEFSARNARLSDDLPSSSPTPYPPQNSSNLSYALFFLLASPINMPPFSETEPSLIAHRLISFRGLTGGTLRPAPLPLPQHLRILLCPNSSSTPNRPSPHAPS